MRYRIFIVASSRTVDHETAPASIPYRQRFTVKQGQYLAFIHTYALLHRRPPAEADIQAFFRVTPPTVHRMIVELERKGLIAREPRRARSLELRVPLEDIPSLL
jgi:repressor LexA